MMYLHPHFLRFPRFPASRRSCSQIPISRTVITGTRIKHSLPPYLHQSSFCRQANQVTHPVYHFTCHHEASVWFCLFRVPVSVQERPERHPGMCCLDPVLRLTTTRSTGRAWRSVSRCFFFAFRVAVSCSSIPFIPDHLTSFR